MPVHLPSNSPESSDQAALSALVSRACLGDTSATAALLRTLAPQMIRGVYALVGHGHADVDDIVQQALIAFIQALPSFRGDCSVSHFANRIVARTVISARYRWAKRSHRYDSETDVDLVESATPSPTHEISAERRRRAVQYLVRQLPEEQAETLGLRVVMGFSLPEVAAATGAPLNTVRSRIRLAKEALKRLIDANAELAETLEADE